MLDHVKPYTRKVRRLSPSKPGTDKSAVRAAEQEPGPSLARKLGAEALGTFILTFVAAGADVVDALSEHQIGHDARYVAPGLVVIALIYALSGISGAHLNPAVTLAFVARRCFPAGRALLYWLVQLTGALAAAALLSAFFGSAIAAGVTHPGAMISPGGGAAWEAALTFVLVVVVLGTAEEKPIVGKNAAIAVGFTVAACGLFSSPISGASMNPARSLGPMIASGSLENWWVYLAGPFAGALVAAAAVWLVHGPPKSSERATAKGEGG